MDKLLESKVGYAIITILAIVVELLFYLYFFPWNWQAFIVCGLVFAPIGFHLLKIGEGQNIDMVLSFVFWPIVTFVAYCELVNNFIYFLRRKFATKPSR